MKWQGRRGSRNIEDRRSSGARRGAGIGGIGALAILAIGYFMGIDVTPLLEGGATTGSAPAQMTAADRRAGEFVSVTLADTETVWQEIFPAEVGRPYDPPILVLFKAATPSPCGSANGATGPFYCPGDNKIYLDTDFFTTLSNRLGAKGDFAAAYVVAHEVAHHVQDQLGILARANQLRAQVSQAQSNAISVRVELQADCLSGVWARYAEARIGALEQGDIAEAMNAAKQIGDDTLQRNAGRRPMPHTFTHGTAAQRQGWFARGYQAPAISTCDTFGADAL